MEHLPSYKDDLYLVHHGIKGQKWGVRRFENLDGTLTPAGTKRYRKERRSLKRDIRKMQRSNFFKYGNIDGKYANQINQKIKDAQNKDKKYRRLSEKVARAEDKASAASNFRDNASEHNMDIAEYEYDKAYSKLDAALAKKEARGKEIADRYLDKYQNAKIKDLGFDDVEQGRKYLEHYKLLDIAYTNSNAGSKNIDRAINIISGSAHLANSYRKGD